METAKVTYGNGDTITTSINGDSESINKYFKLGSYFNIGDGRGGDNMQPVTRCEMLLTISNDSPLSSQLQRLTGDSYNAIDFENEDGTQVRAGGTIRHKKTGHLFTIID